MGRQFIGYAMIGLWASGFLFIPEGAGALEPKFSYTLENLQYAYTEEINVADRYAQYALKAEEEGYASAASLFRAATHAEKVHAANHATAIKKLGGQPKAFPIKTEIRSTRENLHSAITGELFEWQTLYRRFIKQAKDENVMEPVRTLEYARSAENQHALLFGEMLKRLVPYDGTRQKFYVCPQCGFIVDAPPKDPCISCGASPDKFEEVV